MSNVFTDKQSEEAVTWTVQKNDLVGGWIVADYPHPLSEWDNRRDGDATKRGFLMAECDYELAAEALCFLLNYSYTKIERGEDGKVTIKVDLP
jgi:hypothetical protein